VSRSICSMPSSRCSRCFSRCWRYPSSGRRSTAAQSLRQVHLRLRERVGVDRHGLERDAAAPAVDHGADRAREERREHRVLDARLLDLRRDVGLRDLLEHRPYWPTGARGAASRGSCAAAKFGGRSRGGPKAARLAEERGADVVGHHERDVEPEAQERVVPGSARASRGRPRPRRRTRVRGPPRARTSDSISAARPRRSNVE
jgi:hypothetical protein